ncbi:cobyrinate a,c-diamide synthase [Desulfopila inferna]|uniref:cobyrinate a,c-diamide synthase n=1 Tax=Desulfopila inferna TaxID=468528 RepID=UPI001F05FB85|nr:cobyrinate a,c-diamide synthase [Desulfopila inferna]
MSSRAFVIAGTQSGSGKTTITLGLMAALDRLGHSVMPYKCGPDFIDPSLHKLVTGKISRNLDLWMAGEQFCRDCFARHMTKVDIGVVEGVMGMFDGGPASSAALAKALDIPVILVLDVRSTAESAAAVLKGFETLDPAVEVKGVILNMVGSSRHLHLVRGAIEQHCRAEILGYLPRTLDFTIPSRHLGLHMGEEMPVTGEKIEKLAETVIEHIDMDRLLEIAAMPGPPAPAKRQKSAESIMRLGVARDKAFCFYYEDNLDIFRRAGAEICYFSPLQDEHLPQGLDGIYLGGGYPELYGAELSGNHSMLREIRQWAEAGRPLYAECGGFMYLSEGITDPEGCFHPMAAVFPATTVMQTRRASLGYREISTTAATFFGPAGTVLRGHEFHYSRIEPNDSIERVYRVDNATEEGYRRNNVIGGYMHLHFGSNEQAVHNFIQFCKD